MKVPRVISPSGFPHPAVLQVRAPRPPQQQFQQPEQNVFSRASDINADPYSQQPMTPRPQQQFPPMIATQRYFPFFDIDCRISLIIKVISRISLV